MEHIEHVFQDRHTYNHHRNDERRRAEIILDKRLVAGAERDGVRPDDKSEMGC